MKQKILILLIGAMALTACCFHTSAQNANRKGWVIELQGGATLGTLYETPDFSQKKENNEFAYRKKGGFSGALGFGYRWATSSQFAVEAKIALSENFSDTKMLQISILPGVRYTTKELFGNCSLYLGLNAGVGILPASSSDGDTGVYVPAEFNVGLNLTNNIYLGLYASCNIAGAGRKDISEKAQELGYKDEFGYIPADYTTHGGAGLKLGFRF